IEFQIFGDGKGNAIHLGERDCSLQRRHQKVLEEAPSPVVTPEERERMGGIVAKAMADMGYRGAGTIEFLWEGGEFYFIEMNTRLQVEHPVTEAITGLDLVREQIRIARGEPLGYSAAPAPRGWAIEVRLCAEDTVRADIGVVAGSEIGIHYDSMLGKVIAHAPTRSEAAQVLGRALEQSWLP